MTEQLFEQSAEYTEMLHKGICLSGEDQVFFIEGGFRTSVCNRGHSQNASWIFVVEPYERPRSSRNLPRIQDCRRDIAAEAISKAETDFGSPQITFKKATELRSCEEFDLCYVNGVLHHIEPADRLEVHRQIYGDRAGWASRPVRKQPMESRHAHGDA